MKNNILISTVLLFSFLSGSSQAKKSLSTTTKFSSIIQLGILEGQADKTFAQFQLVNGIQHNDWFYGIGLGIDYYNNKRSVPLFLDVKKDLLKRKTTPFIYADAGYNFSWLRDKDKIAYWGTDYKQKGGVYYETGLGYKFILKNKMALGFSAGYSFKQQKEFFTNFVFNDFPPYTQSSGKHPDIYDYKFRRICLKFNCSF